MKFLVLSDPHANWHAMAAVLKDARGRYEQVVCCGDLVGYNAQPDLVVDWIAANSKATVRGNHDKGVAGLDDLSWFNDIAQAAALWSRDHLNDVQRSFLYDLPSGPLLVDHFELFHGAPQDEDEYVMSSEEAAACFEYLRLPLAFFGHTHVQGGFSMLGGRVSVIPAVLATENERVIELNPDTWYMVNSGSVGQPRDGDPRAAYALYDSEKRIVTLRRTPYDVQKTADDIRRAGLPDSLAARLFLGM